MYVMAAAAVMQGVGALMKGQSESKMLDYQADLQTNNAFAARQAAKANADRQSVIAARQLGDIPTEYGASGVDTKTSGSALAIIGASAANAELDRQEILHGGTIRAINYQNQASLDRSSARNALTGSLFNAGASLVGGGARLYAYNTGGPKSMSQDEDT